MVHDEFFRHVGEIRSIEGFARFKTRQCAYKVEKKERRAARDHAYKAYYQTYKDADSSTSSALPEELISILEPALSPLDLVILQAHAHDWKHVDIADFLGIDAARIRVTFKRAKEKAKSKLEQDHPEYVAC